MPIYVQVMHLPPEESMACIFLEYLRKSDQVGMLSNEPEIRKPEKKNFQILILPQNYAIQLSPRMTHSIPGAKLS